MDGIARVGLTGGIGSGKSAVAAIFAEHGVPVLDLDHVGRQMSARPENTARLAAAFGREILRADGSLDRERLAGTCFSSAAKTARLNRIMHPLIWREAENWVARQQAAYVLIEASVLIESGGASRMDAVVAVLADEALRRRRVLRSRDFSPARFQAILERQCDDQKRRAVADYIVENNGNMAELRKKIEGLHGRLTRRFTRK